MIDVEGLNLTLGSFAMQNIDLHVEPGEYFVLLGPSGSGKTLLLESLCGLHRVDSGRISIHGTDVTQLEPRWRSLGYLPQDYALFPHLSVRSNVGFGLGNPLSLAMGNWKQRIDETMQRVGIDHLAHRRPRNLSGGEKQRVALARALATRPRVVLLDEPVSALDEQTRDSLCRQLKQIQQETGTTTVHVCHNFAEMMAVADRVGVIHEGRIVQIGTPQEVLQQPNSAFIARFVQAGNVFKAQATYEVNLIRLTCGPTFELMASRHDNSPQGATVHFAIRPEAICLTAAAPQGSSFDTTVVEGRSVQISDLGPLVQVRVAVEPKLELLVSLGKKEHLANYHTPGDTVFLTIDSSDVHVMES
jgi:ABC-type Fe3+/spermidine/putrescine transport system ATPase subunit